MPAYAQLTFNTTGFTGDPIAVFFPYLAREHVKVCLNYNPTTREREQTYAEGTDYAWIDNENIDLLITPPAGQTITVVRETPIEEPVVSWISGGGGITSDELELSSLQILYVVQERSDQVTAGGEDAADALQAAEDATIGIMLDNTITTAKYQDGSVTEPKLESSLQLYTQIAESCTNECRNLLINPGFSINQRAYWGALTNVANQYVADMWQVAASGTSVTFGNLTAPLPSAAHHRMVTIPAGTALFQAVRGEMALPGPYCVTWEGTATATYGGSPISKGAVIPDINANPSGSVDLRFSNGTLWFPRIQPGTRPTPFANRSVAEEFLLCQSHLEVGKADFSFVGINTASMHIPFRVAKDDATNVIYIPGIGDTHTITAALSNSGNPSIPMNRSGWGSGGHGFRTEAGIVLSASVGATAVQVQMRGIWAAGSSQQLAGMP